MLNKLLIRDDDIVIQFYNTVVNRKVGRILRVQRPHEETISVWGQQAIPTAKLYIKTRRGFNIMMMSLKRSKIEKIE